MAKQDQVDRLEITRMANGYMVCRGADFNRADSACLKERYVFNDFAEAAKKVLEMLGSVDKD